MALVNGEKWYDTAGDTIHAHGGWILRAGDYWYWYGENRIEGNFVSCYRSKDLREWEFCNNILTVNSRAEKTRVRADLRLVADTVEGGGEFDSRTKVNIERPKVVFCKKTGRYVMWAHYENGRDYSCAGVAVASCDTPDGDFVYHGSFNPYGMMSRDCTLFEDDDGSVYFISAARDNADLNVYRLQDDFLNVGRFVTSLFPNEYREAPAIFKKDGRYWLLTSFCTGWAPNQAKYSYADRIDGDWAPLAPASDETTYMSQPAFVLDIPGKGLYYFGDRWGGNGYEGGWGPFVYNDSTYVVCPIKIEGDSLSIVWQDEF